MPDGMIVTRPMPRLFCSARFAPDSVRDVDGTTLVDVIFTTGAAAPQVDIWTGVRYIEELVVTPEAVDLSRLNAGAPALRSHDRFDTDSIVGHVVPGSARIANGEGYATIELSKDAEDARTVAQIRAGHLRHISVGYRVNRYERTVRDGKPELWRAVSWQPFEVSFVAVPADAGAGVRAADSTYPCDIVTIRAATPTTQESAMTETVTPPAVAPAPATLDEARVRAEAAATERQRIAGIHARGAALGLEPAQLQRHIDAGTDLESVTTAMFAQAAARAPGPIASGRIEITRDERETLRLRFADAVFATMNNQAPVEHAREFAGLTFHGLMRELAARDGEVRMSRAGGQDLATHFLTRNAHSSSDFAAVLANSSNKTIRHLYGGMLNTWSAWCEEVEVDDFKTITAANIGPFPEPTAISEGGAYQYGSIGEESETYAVRERGRIVSLTRPAIINDDMRALQEVLRGAAVAGYTALRRVVFGILTTNGAMADTVALFHATHGNLGTAGNLSATTYGELWACLGNQTMPYRPVSPGETAAPMPPPQQLALIVSPTEVRTAYELVGNVIVPTAPGSALPAEWRTLTTVVQDGFLNTGSQPYYLARTDMKAIEIAYLRGGRSPSIMTAEQFDVSGVSFKVMFDFGAKAVTYRTIAGNLG